jgi:hypothetical protein
MHRRAFLALAALLPWLRPKVEKKIYFSAYPHGPLKIEATKAKYWASGKFIGEFPVTWTNT